MQTVNTPPSAKVSPTLELYQALDRAFGHFNDHIFEGQLPACLISIRSGNRVQGYHQSERFISSAGDLIGEIGLHPSHFALQPVEIALSTLVHEMVHLWQNQFGKPTRTNPHNPQWAAKMREIGLHPSHTGLPGGRQTGRSMSDYILPGGPYWTVCKDLLAQGYALPWMDRHMPVQMQAVQGQAQALKDAGIVLDLSPPPTASLSEALAPNPAFIDPPARRKAPKRLRYVCPSCSARAWADPDAALMCATCETDLER